MGILSLEYKCVELRKAQWIYTKGSTQPLNSLWMDYESQKPQYMSIISHVSSSHLLPWCPDTVEMFELQWVGEVPLAQRMMTEGGSLVQGTCHWCTPAHRTRYPVDTLTYWTHRDVLVHRTSRHKRRKLRDLQISVRHRFIWSIACPVVNIRILPEVQFSLVYVDPEKQNNNNKNTITKQALSLLTLHQNNLLWNCIKFILKATWNKHS